MEGIIYCLTNLVNGKRYIGQTKHKLELRIKQHVSKNSCCSLIHKALIKYSLDWFDLKIIDTASSIDELNKKEIYWIEKFGTLVPNGYNLTTGGIYYKASNIIKQEASKRNKGKIFGPPKKTLETKRKKAESMGGKKITFNGESLYKFEWVEKTGIPFSTITNRLKKGWSIEKTLTTKPIDNRKNITFKGKTQCINKWANEIGLDVDVLWSRFKAGWSVEKALTTELGSNIIKLTFNNKTQTLSEWASELNIKHRTIEARLNRGWSVEQALSTKKLSVGESIKRKYITFNNKTMNISQWSKETGINVDLIYYRLSKEWPIDKILTKKVKNK